MFETIEESTLTRKFGLFLGILQTSLNSKFYPEQKRNPQNKYPY